MKLKKVVIKRYKHLREISLDMDNQKVMIGDFPVKFCIGRNGSGKSAFLEAVALIFSRVSQNELPGFEFELAYTVWVRDIEKKEGREVLVKVSPEKNRKKGRLNIEIDGCHYHSFEGMGQYLPYKVITYVSGPNSQMQNLLVTSMRNSIISDIYDLEGNEESRGEMERLLAYLSELKQNPRNLYLNEELAVLALFVLCAWRPEGDAQYGELRKQIFDKLSGGLAPKALSLRADSAYPFTSLFAELFYTGEKAKNAGTRQLNDWVSEEEQVKNAVFSIEAGERGFCAKRLARRYHNPIQLLSILLQAKLSGALKECHIFFGMAGSSELLDEKALSDGELLWIARMGLVLLGRQESTDNCLFLFDEPDVHLNESWNVDFVSFLKKLSVGKEREIHHEFLVSTHSSLILTDALPEQIYLFERQEGGVKANRAPGSYFGANRGEVSKMLFERDAETGTYSEEVLNRIIEKEENIERLMEYIRETGPGFNRFRLLDKYYEKNKG